MTHRPIITSAVLSLMLACLLLAGCVTTGGTAKPDPKLAGQYVQKAQEFEKKGDLPAALEQYKLALTVDPKNSVAAQNRERLSKKLTQLADERYALGMKYYKQGKYGLARKQFLVALKYKPDHPKASQMLVSRQPEKTAKYTTHVVQKGESLSIIAKKYYGDYKKYDIIARFNNIEDATRVKPGQTIMIPDSQGVLTTDSKMMKAPQKGDFVWHTIQPGQSISRLAKIYYGDFKKFHLIAQFNDMDDATRIKVGDRVKVPKIAGLPFTPPAAMKKAAPKPAPAPAPSEETTAQPAPMPIPDQVPPPASTTMEDTPEVEEKEEEDAQIFAYRDAGIALYNEGKYEDAIFELNKAVEAAPYDSQTKIYLANSYFESGKTLYEQQDFEAAREAFESALQFDPQCTACEDYIEKSKSGPLLAYRTKGIDHLNRNEFTQAIAEFDKFLQAQPSDSEIRGLLSKAYFQKALIDYNKGDFRNAKDGFESSLAFDGNCGKCSDYISQSEESFKETHYNKGKVYYSKQQLEEAVLEWQQVHDMDPGYKDVEQNLSRARDLMQKLEKIKKSRKP